MSIIKNREKSMAFNSVNSFKIPKTYYNFYVKNRPEYENKKFVPVLSVTRENDKVVKFYVEFYEIDIISGKESRKKMISYNQNVDNQELYFQSIQNNNYDNVIVNSLLFLKIAVEAIREIIQDMEAEIDVLPDIPVDGHPTLKGDCSIM